MAERLRGLQIAISRRVMGVVRSANVHRQAYLNRNGWDAAAQNEGDVGPTWDIRGLVLDT